MFATRRRREDARVSAFLSAIRATADGATPLPEVRTDTVRLPRIIATQAVPMGGWAVAG